MKKLALYFVSFCSFFFVGCSDNSPTPTHTVMFNVDGGSAVTQQTIEENKKATKPEDPTKDLYTFVGWYSDEALTTSFDFETPITANTTLYAKWTDVYTVTYKSDASTEVGTQEVPVATPTLTKDNFAIDGKYISNFFSDEEKNTAFSFPKELTADITIYVTSAKDVVTPADNVALATEVENAIVAEGNSADLNYINTEKVKDMKGLFSLGNRQDFNGDISLWNVSAVTDMTEMFNRNSAFNGDISKWDVSAVEKMANMFSAATVFNADISGWKVSAVTDMTAMFSGASAFNQDIGSWDVSSLQNGFAMFRNATAFDQDISSWEVSSVFNTRSMFENATAFDQDLDAWSAYLTLDDNGKFTSSDPLFTKADMFKDSPREDNPPNWY